MAISGMSTGKNRTIRMITVGTTAGVMNSNPAQPSHQAQPDRNNTVRMRLGREITRDVGDNVAVRNYEIGSSSRKRERPRKQSRFADDRQRNVVPRRTHYGRRRETLYTEEEDGDVEEISEEFSRQRSILFWLIDSGVFFFLITNSGVVNPDSEIYYANIECTRVLREGKITTDGILCYCCYRLLTVSEFEIHAGSRLNDPYRNIFIERGINLFECLVLAWEKQEKSALCSYHVIEDDSETDQNDDTCGTCGDGGVLICCNGCPSTYHQSCMGIEVLPAGDWICPSCKCKFCGRFRLSPAGPLRTCRQCERRFHEYCNREVGVRINSPKGLFCGQNCTKLFERLKELIGFNNPLQDGYSWTLHQRMEINRKFILFRETARMTCNAKLAVALKVIEECFDPIIDPRSGVNMIQHVVYNIGSNLTRLNFAGFYTAILERGDEIISVAFIRIHGTRLAEMPFIGTRNIYRRQGMCHRLLNAIESKLRFLGVEKLIIPSIQERVEKWIKGYGFRPIEDTLRQEMRSMNLLIFPATVILEKNLVPRSPPGPLTADLDVSRRPLLDLNLPPPDVPDNDIVVQ